MVDLARHITHVHTNAAMKTRDSLSRRKFRYPKLLSRNGPTRHLWYGIFTGVTRKTSTADTPSGVDAAAASHANKDVHFDGNTKYG